MKETVKLRVTPRLTSVVAMLVLCLVTASAQPWTEGHEDLLAPLPGLLSPLGSFWPEVEETVSVTIPIVAPSEARPRRSPHMIFEENAGQQHPEVRFFGRGPGFHAFFTETEMVLLPSLPSDREQGIPTALRMGFEGARTGVSVQGEAMEQAKKNYFIGNDPDLWKTNISTFARVRYSEIYPGIDLVFYSNAEGRLEYDYLVAPGADPSRIVLTFEGADDVEVNADGDLVLRAGTQTVCWRKPRILQDIAGIQVEVAGHYRIRRPDTVSEPWKAVFEIHDYEPSVLLVIDPVLVYSTYLGGSQPYDDFASGVAVDEEGSAYVTGTTQTVDFPTKNPFQSGLANPSGALADVFVSKFDAAGQLVYSTYVGGDSVDNNERRSGIKVDAEGNAVVAGFTISANFPTRNAIQPQFIGQGVDDNNSKVSDCFVFKLSPDGSALVYSTYFGGTGSDNVTGIDMDSDGNLYVAGMTRSSDLPTTPNAFQPNLAGDWDIFLFKLSPDGQQLAYSTYLGGSGLDISPFGATTTIVVDTSGRAYLAGGTSSADFPTVDAMQPQLGGMMDGFLTIVSPDGGSLLFSTYLGGPQQDSIYGLLLGSGGDLYLHVASNSPNVPPNPLRIAGTSTRTISRFNPWTKTFIYSTYFWGVTFSSSIGGLALDQAGNLYVTGHTDNVFPLVNSLQGHGGGGGDAYISVLNAAGDQLLFSTFLGGGGWEGGGDIAIDKMGDIHLVGTTDSANFPVVDAFQSSRAGSRDAFYSVISTIQAPLQLRLRRSGEMILISWPSSVTGAVLESAVDSPVGPWNPVQGPPALIGDEMVFTLEPKETGEFFRLRQ